MNMQSGVVQNTGRTMQMNSFKAHSVLDQAWKQSHLSVIRLDAGARTQRHAHVTKDGTETFIYFHSRVIKQHFSKVIKKIIPRQYHFAASCKLFLFFAVAGIIVHIIVLIYFLCLLMFDLKFNSDACLCFILKFSLQSVLIYVANDFSITYTVTHESTPATYPEGTITGFEQAALCIASWG